MDSTIEINGQTYRLGKMPAKQQFHVARRLAPLLAGLSGIAGGATDLGSMIGPIAGALSKMSDEDTDYVLDRCLDVCQRQQGSNFAAVQARGGGLMFQDIDMPVMLRLAVAVIQFNLGGFFPAPSAPDATTAGQA